MHRYITRVFVAAAASVAVSTVGITAASASGAAPRGRAGGAGVLGGVVSHGVRLRDSAVDQALQRPRQRRRPGPVGGRQSSGSTVYVTGNSYGKGTSSIADYATVAYNAATGTQLWVARYNGLGNGGGQAESVAVSPSGSTVFVTGFATGTKYSYYATVAYSAATGAQLWVKLYHGSAFGGSNEAFSLAVSPNGSTVFVTGQTYNSGSPYYATIAYNAATGSQLWIRIYHGSGNFGFNAEAGASVAVESLWEHGVCHRARRDLELSPTTPRWPITPPPAPSCGSSSTGTRAATARPPRWPSVPPGAWCSSADITRPARALATPRLLTARPLAPSCGSRSTARSAAPTPPISVAVSPSGKTVFVTGGVYGGGGEGDEDYATVAYNAATGTQLWVKRYNPDGGTNYAYSVAVSPTGGTVYVTGGSGDGYATIAYNAVTGAQLWVKRYDGTPNYAGQPPEALSVAVSPTTGTVFVTGCIISVGGSNYDYTTIAYQG